MSVGAVHGAVDLAFNACLVLTVVALMVLLACLVMCGVDLRWAVCMVLGVALVVGLT